MPEAPTTHTPTAPARKPPAQDGPTDLAGFAPAEAGLSPADLAALDLLTLERLHLAHALLDDAALPEHLCLPPGLAVPCRLGEVPSRAPARAHDRATGRQQRGEDDEG